MNNLKPITILISLFISTLSFSQEDLNLNNDEQSINQTVNYTLQDFNDKYYSIFKESYNGFKNYKGKDAEIIDFENGEKESIIEKDGLTSYTVDFYTAMDKELSKKLFEDIINRILITSPKGFQVKHTSENNTNLISYNLEYPTKSAHQPTLLIWIDQNDFTVKLKITEPVLK